LSNEISIEAVILAGFACIVALLAHAPVGPA
jgi:hypothetical protein